MSRASLAFLGTPAAAVTPLRALVEAGHDIALVVSRPDWPRGRGHAVESSPVKAAAVELGLRVTTRAEEVIDSGAELGVVVAYGALIKKVVLDAVPMINLHFSLLPRWRGAAPVERSILAGDVSSGVCLMALDEGLDTGPLYACQEVQVGSDESADELRSRLVGLGTTLLVHRLEHGLAGLGTPSPQEGEPTYAAKLSKEDLRLDWRRPASELARVVRCGRAWTTIGGRRLLVLRARAAPPAVGNGEPGRLTGTSVLTASGSLELVEVQPEGRSPMPAAAWLRGARLADATVLGT